MSDLVERLRAPLGVMQCEVSSGPAPENRLERRWLVALEAADEITTLRAEVEKLRAALDAVLLGGNHLVSIIGPCHPPAGMAHDYVLSYYGPGHQYDAWCCWNAIMAARAALEESSDE